MPARSRVGEGGLAGATTAIASPTESAWGRRGPDAVAVTTSYLVGGAPPCLPPRHGGEQCGGAAEAGRVRLLLCRR